MTWAATAEIMIAATGTTYGIYSGERANKQQQSAVSDQQQQAKKLEADKKRKAALDSQGAQQGGYAGTLGSGSQALGGG